MIKINLVIAILILNVTICFSQAKNKNVCVINFDLKGLPIDRNKAEIEIYKYQADSVKTKVAIETIKNFKDRFKISFKADAAFTGFFDTKYSDTLYAESSIVVFSNEQINCRFTDKDWFVIKSKQNDFYQANSFLLFDWPGSISKDEHFSRKLIKQSYEFEETGSNMETAISLAKMKEYERNILKVVAANKSYFLTICKLEDIKDFLSPKTLDTCFSIMNKTFGNTTYANKLNIYIEQSKKLIVGKNVPLFRSSDKEGNIIKSDSLYKSYDYTLLDFWASWCVPCREKMKVIKHLYNNIDTSKFQMVSLSIDDDQTAPFFFQVTVSDIKKFAYLLFVIAQAFADMGSKDALPGFHIDAANFLNNANENNMDVKTWGLIFVANQFL
jgi:thiol-disulfide isomerase/thioredoxin